MGYFHRQKRAKKPRDSWKKSISSRKPKKLLLIFKEGMRKTIYGLGALSPLENLKLKSTFKTEVIK